jgi:prepilin-type N-terminal cleavage/methylation domain-containing protein
MKNNFQKGLTLIEMLIVVSIVVIFSAMVFGNSGTGKEGLAIDRAGQKLQQDLRRAQELAMSGSFGTTGAKAVGIHFDEINPNQTIYRIYYDLNSDYVYNGTPTDSIMETVTIETGVKICDIIDDDNGAITYPNNRSVSFAPPEPVTRINGDNTLHNVSIVLCLTNDNTKTRIININNAGRIDVNNP